MAKRTFPSYRVYKDVQGKWRWTYNAKNGQTIAVSSESYNARADCENGIRIMKQSNDSAIWLDEETVAAS